MNYYLVCHVGRIIGTFRSDYGHDYEYEISNVHLACMRDSVSMSRKLVLSSKSHCRPLADYEIFKKTCFPSMTQFRRVKRLVFIADFTSFKGLIQVRNYIKQRLNNSYVCKLEIAFQKLHFKVYQFYPNKYYFQVQVLKPEVKLKLNLSLLHALFFSFRAA